MTTALLTHPDCHGHINPEGHPEQVARLHEVLKALHGKDLLRKEAPLADDASLLLCHPQAHLDALNAAAPDTGTLQLDADTYMTPGSLTAAYRAAGGAVRAVDMVMGGEAANVFVACRPPGHHAETERPMGFCLFGNVAVAARHALEVHGLKRVAIVDFDVHHGNGTQDLLWDEGRALFISTHQMPLYPGTGAQHERGAHGQITNIPLSAGTDGGLYRKILTNRIIPLIEAFEPEMLFLSAGFDAHKDDPLASIDLSTEDFGWITQELAALAGRVCGGRVVSCLEGGYNLPALAASAAAHVDALIAAGAR
ncbi:acetoin utilization protein [Primorskyibacter flagellatus]|uniref:Acetoin utilization protein n=1 Tax=Primorskyibacter flagellatus TaxID=1387277 RepID=A0A917ADM0_9RHOB|nr:histone deacetylase family protein [Primorskyibacter flagellatus]GGE44419.1 acetoin utilization protein [Primorskyibacter flagellatus]